MLFKFTLQALYRWAKQFNFDLNCDVTDDAAVKK